MTVTLHAQCSICRRFTLHVAKDAGHNVQIRCDLPRGKLVFDRNHGAPIGISPTPVI